MRLYTLPSDRQIQQRAKRKWGLARIFRWAKGRAQDFGETVILTRILLSAQAVGVTFPRNTISRVIREEIEEDLTSEVKNKLRDLGRAR